jgi:nucleoside phosphorylase/CheY-like chemotaxis protein
MKILLLEDDFDKREEIKTALLEMDVGAEITEVTNGYDYLKKASAYDFDLILLDLLVPRSAKDPKVEDHCEQLIDATRSTDSRAFRTPAIVLTKYLETSEDFFSTLNKVDINVISFASDGDWKHSLNMKVIAARPKVKFDFVIICALAKEAMAYKEASDYFGPLKTINGLLCREISIVDNKGVVIELPRMGLVSSGVIAAYAIERFNPKLICMSGICGGAPGESKIYDVLVTEVCHQHDVGKWTDKGFKLEHYDIQVETKIRNRLQELIHDPKVNSYIETGLNVQKSEYPQDVEIVASSVRMAATSSGSAVMAEEGKTASLSVGQRKLAGFDMEVYAIFEAARLSDSMPSFFAAKTVVDDGDKNKGDRFHRIGCLLSAKFVASAIRSGIVNL